MEIDIGHDYKSYPLTNPVSLEIQSAHLDQPHDHADNPDLPLDGHYSQQDEYYDQMYQFANVAESAQQ